MEGKICDPALAGFVFVSFSQGTGELTFYLGCTLCFITVAFLSDHPGNVDSLGFGNLIFGGWSLSQGHEVAPAPLINSVHANITRESWLLSYLTPQRIKSIHCSSVATFAKSSHATDNQISSWLASPMMSLSPGTN
jgi:hypothetical protein